MAASSLFAVAVHVLALMATQERPLTSRYISRSASTHPVVIRRIIGALSRAGLVHTHLGTEGGSSLARPPESITLHDVYRAVDSGNLFALHHSPPSPDCECGRNIQPVLLQVFDRASAAVRETLQQITLRDVVDEIRLCECPAEELQAGPLSGARPVEDP